MLTLLKSFKEAIINYSRPSWDLKTYYFVPSDQKRFLLDDAWRLKWVLKYLKRRLYMKLLGQDKKELSNIPATAKNILWVNLSAPSLGDSLMDLSARQMLKDFNVDLLTDKKNLSLYQNDPFFKHAYSDVNDLSAQYDLLILDAYSHRILKIKAAKMPDVPFVGMWGFVNGFEVHRTLYSFYRMQFLLDGKGHISKLSPIVQMPAFFEAGLDVARKKIALVIGAEWSYRRYNYWLEVLAGIFQGYGDDFEILLVGSSNGVEEAGEISVKFPQCKNFVGKCTLDQTASLIQQSNLVIAADGGLWHLACALNKPSLVLFADKKLFDEDGSQITLVTRDISCEVLYTDKNVSEIKPEQILSELNHLISNG